MFSYLDHLECTQCGKTYPHTQLSKISSCCEKVLFRPLRSSSATPGSRPQRLARPGIDDVALFRTDAGGRPE